MVDHLVARPDVEGLGAAGVSLGGMASWLLAACDERVAAAAPAIGAEPRALSKEVQRHRKPMNTYIKHWKTM